MGLQSSLELLSAAAERCLKKTHSIRQRMVSCQTRNISPNFTVFYHFCAPLSVHIFKVAICKMVPCFWNTESWCFGSVTQVGWQHQFPTTLKTHDMGVWQPGVWIYFSDNWHKNKIPLLRMQETDVPFHCWQIWTTFAHIKLLAFHSTMLATQQSGNMI